jgi:cephalosporin hydroxylase
MLPEEIDAALVLATDNWRAVRWRGRPLWQNLLDLNVISEHILAYCPDVIVETGTYYGGSAIFFADMMRLTGVPPAVCSIDLAPADTPAHPGVVYFAGRSSADPALASEVAEVVGGRRTFVVLDSDHSADHVYRELLLYSGLVRPGGNLLVQDGNMRTTIGLPLEATPLGGIARFLGEYPHFQIDAAKTSFRTTSHPSGWLRRIT